MTASKIEWTEQVWNPVVGCTVHSPGCTNCYAMRMAHRLEAMGREQVMQRPQATVPLEHYLGTTRMVNGNPVWTGKIGLSENALLAPLRRRKPTRYFVNSMSDLFHIDVPQELLLRIYAVMIATPQHTYQVLTKRSDRMRQFLQWVCETEAGSDALCEAVFEVEPEADLDFTMPPENVWLGVSVEDQTRADERIPDLLATPAAVRWISAEPLLGPVDLESAWHGENALDGECWGECGWCPAGFPPLHNCQQGRQPDAVADKGRSGLDWVVAGGESGPGARPMHPDWARSLRDQCASAGVPFFFKQWGEWVEVDEGRYNFLLGPTGEHCVGDDTHQNAAAMRHVGKKAAGRLLDGIEHNAMPGDAP